MRWREFQVVPSRESAIECLRVYFTLGETVIQLAAYHPIDRLRLQGRASDRRQRPAAHPDRAEGRLRRARPARLDHPSHARPALPHGQRRDVDRARDRPSDRRRHRQVLRHLPRLPEVLPAGRDSGRAQLPKPARIISATTATSSTPAAAFRTSRSTRTARSACRSASTTTRSGRATSTALRRSCFPMSSCLTPLRRSICRRIRPTTFLREDSSPVNALRPRQSVTVMFCLIAGPVAGTTGRRHPDRPRRRSASRRCAGRNGHRSTGVDVDDLVGHERWRRALHVSDARAGPLRLRSDRSTASTLAHRASRCRSASREPLDVRLNPATVQRGRRRHRRDRSPGHDRRRRRAVGRTRSSRCR